MMLKNYDFEVLEKCNGEKTITQISKEIDLCYSSVWGKLTNLKKRKLINWKENNNISQGLKPFIIDDETKQQVEFYKNDKSNLNKLLSKKENKQGVLDLLKELTKKRFLSDSKSFYILNKKCSFYDIPLLQYQLIKLGYIKRRLEATKKGKEFLNKNKKQT